jgi:murein DD-endopeptidase MepM/ murein hydrolase activator NlpD
VIWDGRKADGKPALDGSYGFAIGDAGGTGARLASGQTGPFDFRNHIFPVRGAHNYGGAGSLFGADRGDHRHQGQDVAAACGTPLVAAQGGTVTTRAYQAGGAGYYVVIRGAASGKDYVYMHLKGPGPLVEGQSVHTSVRIGKVGNTGSSSGCHLHFERWTKPGWYAGGHPFDPLASLQYWDSYS